MAWHLCVQRHCSFNLKPKESNTHRTCLVLSHSFYHSVFTHHSPSQNSFRLFLAPESKHNVDVPFTVTGLHPAVGPVPLSSRSKICRLRYFLSFPPSFDHTVLFSWRGGRCLVPNTTPLPEPDEVLVARGSALILLRCVRSRYQ